MKILLLGLGRANRSVARYCLERGDNIWLFEEHLESLSSSAHELIDSGAVRIHEHGDYDMIVSSPGFPAHKDIITEYQKKNTMVIDEIEFTYQELKDSYIIGVTGTNGKSTTAALIHTILSTAGLDCFLGGNIAPGKPFSEALFEPRHQYYVLEISSFQLMRIREFHPRIGVLTNVSIDHLNWHTDIEEYYEAKRALFRNQTSRDTAVLNYEDDVVQTLTRDIASTKLYFGRSAHEGAHCNGSFRFGVEQLFPCTVTSLPGEHNIMNVLAAIAVSKKLAITTSSLQRGIKQFKPLPHRLEDCGVHNSIHYINNSMCTNERAAIVSFNAISGSKIIIVGGRQKGDKALDYLALLVKKAKACVIMGDNAPAIQQYFIEKKYTQFAIARDMDSAVQLARTFAQKNDIIMLNPGFASFGLFRDFEERGEAFRHAVGKN